MRKNFPFLVFCAYNMVQPASAAPAAPNTLVTLSEPVVRVSDLFANAGPEADRVLGAAPAPGARIVVGTAQLAAIAAAYQVPWQPDGSAPEVVLASPGNAMPLAPIRDALAQAVASAGGPPDPALSLPGLVPPMIPPGAVPSVTVTRLDLNPATGDFSASLAIQAPRMAPQNLDVSGQAQPSVVALTASHALQPGQVLTAADVTPMPLPQSQAGNAVTATAQALGMAVATAVPAGAPLMANNLTTPVLVQKGALVVLSLSGPGMKLTAQGIALGTGGIGSAIPVLNPASHAVVEAVVSGPGTADIAPGSMPLTMAQNVGSYGGNGSYGGYASYAQAHGAHLAAYQPMAVQP